MNKNNSDVNKKNKKQIYGVCFMSAEFEAQNEIADELADAIQKVVKSSFEDNSLSAEEVTKEFVRHFAEYALKEYALKYKFEIEVKHKLV